LEFVQLAIDAVAQREQLLMRAAFAQLSFMHDENAVGALNGREAVSDHQRRASFDHSRQRVADAKFGFRIDA
jgi:hypothetical protein